MDCERRYCWGINLSIPFVGFIQTAGMASWILYNFQFPLLGSDTGLILELLIRLVSFNSLCWVPRMIEKITGRNVIPFQFPLLGSWKDGVEHIFFTILPFNSLCWVLLVVVYPQLISLLPTFNSLCWVQYVNALIGLRESTDFQFPLLGSSPGAGLG